jgi:hypothetical protein
MDMPERQDLPGAATPERRQPTVAHVVEVGPRPFSAANDNPPPVRRRSDGSLDVDYYKTQARELRRAAFARFVTWMGEELLGRPGAKR